MAIRIAPLTEPTKQLYGLLECVTAETIDDPHWQCGEDIVYDSEPCGPAVAFSLNTCDEDGNPIAEPYGKDGKPLESHVQTTACGTQIVYGDTCSARTLVNNEYDIKETARQGLICKEGIALEKAFWNNELDCEYEVEELCPGEELRAYDALAAIENKFAENGMVGYIHVPTVLLYYLKDCFDVVDGKLRTLAGSIVIAGGGYCDEDSTGETTTIKGTGRIRLFKGEQTFSPDSSDALAAVNAGQNVVEWRAERSWGIGLDPCCKVLEVTAKFC